MSTEAHPLRTLGLIISISLLVYLVLPVHRVLPVCHSRNPSQAEWQAMADMSPTFRRLFIESLRSMNLTFVEVGPLILTWPYVFFTANPGSAQSNAAVKISYLLASPSRRNDVLTGEAFGFPARLPAELWQRLMDDRSMDECDMLRIAVKLEPNVP